MACLTMDRTTKILFRIIGTMEKLLQKKGLIEPKQIRWYKKLGYHGIEVLSSNRSDHLPLLLSTRSEASKWPRQNKVFIYESK